MVRVLDVEVKGSIDRGCVRDEGMRRGPVQEYLILGSNTVQHAETYIVER